MTSPPNPRAIAIVLGHLGATKSTLERYASWYRQRSCVPITGASPPLRFLRNASLGPSALHLWEETLEVLRESPPHVPVVVHMFSNGGSFLWDAMDRLLVDETTCLSQEDRKLLQTRLSSGCLIFDSCPCYIRTVWDTSSPWNESFPYPGWSPWKRTLYTGMAATALTTWLTATLSWGRPQQFWKQVTESTTCEHHVYVYTTTDLASDAAAVDRLVENRRRDNVGTTTQCRYDDSNHCRIDQDHPEDYQRMIDEALDAACQRAVTQDRNE